MPTYPQNKFQKQQKSLQLQAEAQNENEDLLTQHKCINCGFGISETADICENCGEWLLKGKCNFCYSDVEPGQKFCAECGNPPEGITCKTCGTLSHFDFCPQCNIPLTEQAEETIQLISESLEFKNIVNINFQNATIADEKVVQSKDELNKLDNYLSKISQQKEKKKNLFKLNDNSNIKIEDNINKIEQSKQYIKNEEKKEIENKQLEIEALRLIEDTRNKTFSNNQEARKFFGALKILLPSIIQKRKTIGWLCNAYDCTHPGGPHECADPSAGGTWIFETIKEKSFKQVEI